MTGSGRSQVQDRSQIIGRRRPRTSMAALLPLAAMLIAGGCANVHNVEVGSIPDDYRTRHPIVVSEDQEAIDIPIVMSDARLSYANRGRV